MSISSNFLFHCQQKHSACASFI